MFSFFIYHRELLPEARPLPELVLFLEDDFFAGALLPLPDDPDEPLAEEVFFAGPPPPFREEPPRPLEAAAVTALRLFDLLPLEAEDILRAPERPPCLSSPVIAFSFIRLSANAVSRSSDAYSSFNVSVRRLSTSFKFNSRA